MVEAVLHAGAWRVEPAWLDRDGTGARTWWLAHDPWGGEQWVTTAGLQELLHRHGLDFGDLSTTAPRLDDPDDGCE